MITDPDGLMGEALRTGLPGTNWISRAVCLCDAQVGLGLPENGEDESGVVLDAIERRFNITMDIAWGQRVGNRTPPVMQREFAEAQTRWMDFLREVEPSFPVITGTARNLQATLLVGLQALIDAVKVPSGFELQVEQVGALAKWVVRQMAQVREEMLRLLFRWTAGAGACLAVGPVDS